MLCRALADTGVAGRAEEYFLAVDPSQLPGWKEWELGPFGVANGATDRESYLEIVYRLGTTPNGVFGAKLMWNNVHWALEKFREMPRFAPMSRAEVFHAVFPNLCVIHLTRRDRVRQAVSWARAAQDGVWVVSDDEPASPTGSAHYSAEFLDGLMGLIVEGEQAWRDFYAELGVEPYDVVYEDLVDDHRYPLVLCGALEHLGLAGDGPIPAPRTQRQADNVNDEWVDRYRADRGVKADGVAIP
jgi:LPS sulfotransferase NodH